MSSSSDAVGSCCQEAARSLPGALGLTQSQLSSLPLYKTLLVKAASARPGAVRAYPDLETDPASPGVGKKGAVGIPGMWWDGKDGTSHLGGGCSLWARCSFGGNSLFLVCPGAFEHLRFERLRILEVFWTKHQPFQNYFSSWSLVGLNAFFTLHYFFL